MGGAARTEVAVPIPAWIPMRGGAANTDVRAPIPAWMPSSGGAANTDTPMLVPTATVIPAMTGAQQRLKS